jgi:hypothetical protein
MLPPFVGRLINRALKTVVMVKKLNLRFRRCSAAGAGAIKNPAC